MWLIDVGPKLVGQQVARQAELARAGLCPAPARCGTLVGVDGAAGTVPLLDASS